MNDREARRLLDGIDGPRPLPDRLRGDIESVLSDGLTSLDEARPVPDDLRARLEATLVGGAPVPARVRRQLLGVTSAPARVAAAIVILVALVGALVAVSRDRRPGEVALPAATSTTAPAATGSGSAGGVASSGGGSAGATAGGTTTTTQLAVGDAASGAAAGVAPSSEQGVVKVAAIGGGVVGTGFHAWIDAHGGQLGGHRVELVSSPSSAVATVNLDDRGLSERADGVVFETAFVEETAIGENVVSLASAPERQATVAVAHAVKGAPTGIRAAVYVGTTSPWSTTVADAIERALDARGISRVRVPFTTSAPAFVPADVAFLSIDAEAVRTWVGAAPSAPRLGTWGVGSAWDEGIAAQGARVGLRSVSPYAVLDPHDRDLLQRQVGTHATVSAALVHGWVTAAALDHLLSRNGGAKLAAADLDALAGWSSGWAPPYEVRRGTRSRTPDAIELVATRGGFVPSGSFETAG